MVIKEKNNWFNHSSSIVILNIPNDYVFNSVDAEMGAGLVDIDVLSTNTLDFDLGAGNVNIEFLNVISDSYIDTGAGRINIKNGNVNNLDLDVGVGNITYKGVITGNSFVSGGIGELIINLSDSLDNYNLNISKGIGLISVNDKEYSDFEYISGSNKITIDGGIGNITLNTVN